MAKNNRTPEEIEKIRQERAEKRALREAEIAKQLEEEQENLMHSSMSKKEKERWVIIKEIDNFFDFLHDKRHAYLEDRDLEKSKLSDKEINQALYFMSLRDEDNKGSVNKVLAEMLKYPEPRLNYAAYEFLAKLLKNDLMGMGFWVYVWSQGFIPNDILELMDEEHISTKHGKTGYAKVLKKMCASTVLKEDITRHLRWEIERLDGAKRITDIDKRKKQIARVEARIAKFKHLLEDVYK